MSKKKRSTKERLLESAARIFAEKGYASTTINEICEAANANIASVNYHFRDKENFYDQVWRYALDLATAEFPLFYENSSPYSPEEELRYFIKQHLRQAYCCGDSFHFCRLMMREMVEPTGLLERVHHELMTERRERVFAILRQILPDEPQTEIELRGFSLISQCLFLHFHHHLREYLLCSVPEDEKLAVLADHIYQTVTMTKSNDTPVE